MSCSKVEEFIGKKFGRLLIIEKADIKNNEVRVKCKCDCGNEKVIRLRLIKAGKTTSCGCYHKEAVSRLFSTHGLSMKDGKVCPEYMIWGSIKQRCYNEKDKHYPFYGGRGIKMYEGWKDSFENFINDMGHRPSISHSVERINVDGDYCKENCKWLPLKEQGRNRRSSIMIEYGGEKKCLMEWCQILNLNYRMMKWRIKEGNIPFEDALLLPKDARYKKWKQLQLQN